jgi:hypothetical protein
MYENAEKLNAILFFGYGRLSMFQRSPAITDRIHTVIMHRQDCNRLFETSTPINQGIGSPVKMF